MNDNTTYIISECATDPSDISMDILSESSAINEKGIKIPIVKIQSTLQSFNIENWNQRIYDDFVVMPAIDNDGMIQQDLKKGQWCGEFGHPLDTSVRRQMIIFPQTSSHRILKYWKEGNLLKAIVESLPYEYGIAMANNALRGIPAAFSLRSLGSVDMQTRRVKKPLKVITYDYV